MSRKVVRQALMLGLLVAFVLVVSACGGGSGGEQAKARTLPSGQDVTLPAGNYVSEEFEPAVSFRLDKGWQYPVETSDMIDLLAPESFPNAFLTFWTVHKVLKVVSSYEAKAQPAPKDLIAWLQNNSNLDTETPEPVTVGGVKGEQFDAVASRIPRDYITNCDKACLPLFEDSTDSSHTLSLYEGDKARFLVLDDVEGKTVAITILAPAVDFEEFLPKAQKVLDTVEWEGT